MPFNTSKKSLQRLAKVIEKTNYRRLMKESLSLINEESFTEMSSLISKNIAQLFSDLNVIQQKICIGAFASIAKEPKLEVLQSKDFEKLTAYPAYADDSKMMTYKMARMSDLVIRKDFGPEILGPKIEAPEVVPGLILIPGLAFSESGDRLGRGKGFYDTYLANYTGIKIGICFSIQIKEMVPTEKHDVQLDYIVTEEKIIKCKHA